MQINSDKIVEADLSLSNVYDAILMNGDGGTIVNYLDVWRTIAHIKKVVEG